MPAASDFPPRRQLLAALADRLLVTRVARAARGDAHDWLPLRQRWEAQQGRPLPEPLWWAGYLDGGALDPRLAGCVVQLVAIDRRVAGDGPWPIEREEDPRQASVVRVRLQRLDDDGFVQGEWDGAERVKLSMRLGSRATLRAHAGSAEAEAWAVRLYRLVEVLRDWTPPHYQTSLPGRDAPREA